jgi:hypothetical protein
MAELEILWTPAAIWALRSFHWREGELLDAAVQKFARTGEGRVARVEGSSLRMRLYAPPYVVRFNLDQDTGVLVVVWIWRQG